MTRQPKWTPEAFWSAAVPEPNTGCLLWSGTLAKDGYGHLYAKGPTLAHRHAWTISRGPIPTDMDVCHKCDTPSCVNPDHLFLGTHLDNMRDRDRKGRWHQGAIPVGSKHYRAKLTEKTVLAIRRGELTGSQRELAERLGVSPCLIGLILAGKRWKHVI